MVNFFFILLFFIVKYLDDMSSKVEFVIQIQITYLNDDFEEKFLEMDLNLNQFYSLYNDFQKIDSMIKTLV